MEDPTKDLVSRIVSQEITLSRDEILSSLSRARLYLHELNEKIKELQRTPDYSPERNPGEPNYCYIWRCKEAEGRWWGNYLALQEQERMFIKYFPELIDEIYPLAAPDRKK